MGKKLRLVLMVMCIVQVIVLAQVLFKTFSAADLFLKK